MDRYLFLRNQKKCGNARENRNELLKASRQTKRNILLEQQRQIDPSPKIPEPPPKKTRLDMLKEWKAQKALNDKSQKNKRPPFYTGKLETTATGSPKLTKSVVKIPITSTSRAGPVTRSRQNPNPNRKMVARSNVQKPLMTGLKKVVNEKMKPVKSHRFAFLLTVPDSPKITRKRENAEARNQSVNSKSQRRIKKQKSSEAFKENVNVSTKDDQYTDLGVAKIEYSPTLATVTNNFQHLVCSPNIELKRGKERKSSLSRKLSMSTKAEDIDKEIKAEELMAQSKVAEFRLFLSNETTRLLGLSQKWKEYLVENSSMPEEAVGDANAVIGKTKLLTSDKFKQFAGLIDKCEEGDPKIKIDDLQGFHDWVSLEVEDLDKAFSQLDEQKVRGWVGKELPVCETLGTKKAIKKKKPTEAKPKAVARSGVMAHIMAARKKLQCVAEGPDAVSAASGVRTEDERAETTVALAMPPVTPKATPSRMRTSTPREMSSLRVQVLRQSTGLMMLAATAMSRLSLSPQMSPLHCKENMAPSATPTFVNKDQTPMPNLTPVRSILKKSAASTVKSVAFNPTPRLHPKYLLPAEDSSDGSPEILSLLSTPVRRSARLAQKSTEKAVRVPILQSSK